MTPISRYLPAVAVITAFAACWLTTAATATLAPVVKAPLDQRPNVVLITTDDMTDYDLRWMPRTRALLRDDGFEFTQFLSPNPLCCPGRASIMTGQHSHNNGVHYNSGKYGGDSIIGLDNNIGKWVRRAGYRTAFVGKFLNHFEPDDVAGWDHFNYAEGGSTYSPYGFKFSEEPAVTDGEYTTDYVGRKTLDYVNEYAATPEPFLIWASYVAPHGMVVDNEWVGAVPEPAYADLYPSAMPPSMDKPSFNERVVTDKPVRYQDEPVDPGYVINAFRNRIRSLRSVDDQVGALARRLARLGELDNTLIIFTSDNGYLLGEHRQIGKNFPYEEALQVPGLVRGPGFPAGYSTDRVMTLVDIAATIVDVANATPGRTLDGTSMLPVADGAAGLQRSLIQGGAPNSAWAWRGVRDARFVYAEHYIGTASRAELYDLNDDPWQLNNLVDERPRLQSAMAERLDFLSACSGRSCSPMRP